MIPKKKPARKQQLVQQQKTRLKIIVAGSSIIALSFVLLIYFNITRVEEMKAKQNQHDTLVERPIDMNVPQLKIDLQAAQQRGVNFKPAKQLETGSAN